MVLCLKEVHSVKYMAGDKSLCQLWKLFKAALVDSSQHSYASHANKSVRGSLNLELVKDDIL